MVRAFQDKKIPSPNLEPAVAQLLMKGLSDVEIGAGQGLHAVQYCQRNPQRTLLAIERTRVKFAALAQRLANHSELTNLIALNADAISVITHCLPDKSIERLFLHYPNPHPKARQANLRWHNSPFMKLLKCKMKPQGHLFLSTNLKWYRDEAVERMQSTWNFKLTSETVLKSGLEPGRTHFEIKYLARGETCYALVFANVCGV